MSIALDDKEANVNPNYGKMEETLPTNPLVGYVTWCILIFAKWLLCHFVKARRNFVGPRQNSKSDK